MDDYGLKERLTYMLKHVRTEQQILTLTENSLLIQLQRIKNEEKRQLTSCVEEDDRF